MAQAYNGRRVREGMRGAGRAIPAGGPNGGVERAHGGAGLALPCDLMFQWVSKTYARRIVNVNVNIIAAGVLALPVVLGVLKLGMLFGLNVSHKALIPVITLVADVIADATIYYVLHWLANHSPWRRQMLEDVAQAADHLNFFKDATIVQFERAVLSPLLYVLWLGTQWWIIHLSDTPQEPTTVYFATCIGFLVAISVTRTLHTIWMLTKDRKRALAAVKRPTKPAVEAPVGAASAAATPAVPPAPAASPAQSSSPTHVS